MRQITAFLPFLLLSPALLLAQANAGSQAGLQAARKADGLLSRVVVCGASMSAGNLHKIFDKGIAVAHKRVGSSTSVMFFMRPKVSGKRLLTKALKKEPTLLIGLDFLFWYSYGNHGRKGNDGSDAEIDARLAGLERGLEELSRYKGPLVLADLPDMTGADPLMLRKSLIPSAKALEKLNERIRNWAIEREKTAAKVLVVPLAEMVKELKGGKMAIRASKDGKHPRVVLTQKMAMMWDRLHPSPIGAVALCARVLEQIALSFGKEARSGIAFDSWKVLEEMGLSEALAKEMAETLDGASSRPSTKKQL